MVGEHYSSPVSDGDVLQDSGTLQKDSVQESGLLEAGKRETVERQSTRTATKTPEGKTSVLAQNQSPPILTEVVHFDTAESLEFFDFTDAVRDSVQRSGVSHGQVTLHTPHTTTTLVLNESETGFLNDFRRLMEKVVPTSTYYEHDDHSVRTENLQEDEFINGHSHCRQMLVGSSSVTLPIVEGEVMIGQWQRILFAELDQARPRRVVIHSQGV